MSQRRRVLLGRVTPAGPGHRAGAADQGVPRKRTAISCLTVVFVVKSSATTGEWQSRWSARLAGEEEIHRASRSSVYISGPAGSILSESKDTYAARVTLDPSRSASLCAQVSARDWSFCVRMKYQCRLEEEAAFTLSRHFSLLEGAAQYSEHKPTRDPRFPVHAHQVVEETL